MHAHGLAKAADDKTETEREEGDREDRKDREDREEKRRQRQKQSRRPVCSRVWTVDRRDMRLT